MTTTKDQLLAEIQQQFPNNTVGLITPAILRAVLSDIVNDVDSAQIVSVEDRATAQATHFALETKFVHLGRYSSAGGFGGAWYVRTALGTPSQAYQFADADGVVWEIAEPKIDPQMVGGIGTSRAADTQALIDAFAYATVKAVPVGLSRSYVTSSNITIPDSVVIYGNGNYVAKATVFDIFNLGDRVIIHDLVLLGGGVGGRGYVVGSTKTRQKLLNCSATAFNGSYCLECVGAGAGSGLLVDGGVWQRTDNLNCAFKWPDDTLVAAERSLVNINCEGGFLLETDSSENTGINNCSMLSMSFTNAPQKVRMANCRVASGAIPADLHVRGSDHVFAANVFSAGVTIESGATGICIDDSNDMVGTITDNSGSATNRLYYGLDFTPVWTASGTAPAIGNGTITGRLKRQGKSNIVSISFAPGSTTTFGTGTWSFSLPAALSGILAKATFTGATLAFDDGVSFFTGTAVVNQGGNAIAITTNGGGNVWGPTVPFTWGNLDYFNLSIAFEST